MKVATFNGCKVYNLSDGKNLPQWISQNKKRALAKDEEHRRRLEIIQDFEMTTATQCLQMTGDKEHVIATGTYPPVVRCYTLSDMTMKFQRGLTAEVVAFESLSDNFGKMVFLQTDRNLNFHAPYGTHYSTRIPKFGRALQYHWSTCDLFVGASGDEVYRLNLEEGRFKEPLQLSYTGCNKMHINPAHPLLACGGETGVVEFWDLRSRRAVSTLPSPPPPGRPSDRAEITAVKFDTDGLTLGVGTSDGRCILYDIRSHQPVYTKEHQYGLPIVDVSFHRESGNVISTDKKLVKIWKRSGGDTGKILTNIEPACDINAVLPITDTRGATGMICVAGEQSKIMTYFVPQLGPAPRWCSYLEGITEELEEKSLDGGNGTTYEDYKFLTKTEVESLGATGLIGECVALVMGQAMAMAMGTGYGRCGVIGA
jgi:ribosome biogenesis protein ENP2